MNDFFIYLEKIELIAFYGGFPLFYFVIYFISTELSFRKAWLKKLPQLLPATYAFSTLLFVGMKIDQWIRNHGAHFNFHNYLFYFQAWAFLGLLFFANYFRTKTVWVILHSIPFVALIIFDFIAYYQGHLQVELLHNEMRLYTLSTILMLVSLLFISALHFIFKKRFN